MSHPPSATRFPAAPWMAALDSALVALGSALIFCLVIAGRVGAQEQLGTPPATAQPQESLGAALDTDPQVAQAREHFQRGVTLYTDGDVDAALLEFKRAYELHPTYRLLYNLGQVSAERHDYVAAEDYFRRYLQTGSGSIDNQRRMEVQEEIKRLQSRIGRVSVLTEPDEATVYIDDLNVGKAPLRDYRVAAGRRQVRVDLAGYKPTIETIDVYGGQTQTLRLALAQLPTAPVASDAFANPPPIAEGRPLLATPAFWTGVSSVGFAIASGAFGYLAYQGQQQYTEALDGRTSREELNTLEDDARQDALMTDIMLGAATVAALTTIVLLIVDEDAEAPPRRAQLPLHYHTRF